jgi:hypothetical protein
MINVCAMPSDSGMVHIATSTWEAFDGRHAHVAEWFTMMGVSFCAKMGAMWLIACAIPGSGEDEYGLSQGMIPIFISNIRKRGNR